MYKMCRSANTTFSRYCKRNIEMYRITVLLGHFWVGGTDVLVDGQWIWISTQEKMQFTDWLPGEPNGGLREGCLMLVSGSNNYHWNDANCHSQQSFICEKK